MVNADDITGNEPMDYTRDGDLEHGVNPRLDMTAISDTTGKLLIDELQAYIRLLRDQMILNHWEVILSTETCVEGANATVHDVRGRQVAAIRVHKDWFTYTPEDQREILVHELLHLTHIGVSDVLTEGIGGSMYLPYKAWAGFRGLFYLEVEKMVDHLSCILAPNMPLPEYGGIKTDGF